MLTIFITLNRFTHTENVNPSILYFTLLYSIQLRNLRFEFITYTQLSKWHTFYSFHCADGTQISSWIEKENEDDWEQMGQHEDLKEKTELNMYDLMKMCISSDIRLNWLSFSAFSYTNEHVTQKFTRFTTPQLNNITNDSRLVVASLYRWLCCCFLYLFTSKHVKLFINWIDYNVFRKSWFKLMKVS